MTYPQDPTYELLNELWDRRKDLDPADAIALIRARAAVAQSEQLAELREQLEQLTRVLAGG
jgi:hypothetical protein